MQDKVNFSMNFSSKYLLVQCSQCRSEGLLQSFAKRPTDADCLAAARRFLVVSSEGLAQDYRLGFINDYSRLPSVVQALGLDFYSLKLEPGRTSEPCLMVRHTKNSTFQQSHDCRCGCQPPQHNEGRANAADKMCAYRSQ